MLTNQPRSNIGNRETSALDGLLERLLTAPNWLLLMASGVILGLAYPPNPIGWLFAGIGFVPLFIVVERSKRWKTDLWQSYLAFLVFSGFSTWWVGSWQANTDPWLIVSSLLLVVVHPLFFSVPVILYGIIRRRTSLGIALLFFVLLFCGGEYLHALGEVSYPWLTLGNTTTYNLYFMQIAEITGVWGLSLLLLAQNGAIGWWLIGRKGRTSDQRRTSVRKTLVILGATTVPVYLVGFFLLGQAVDISAENESVNILIVQPNQNPWDKWRKDDPVDHIVDNGTMTIEGIKQVGPVDAVLWAENAIPYPLTNPRYADRKRTMASVMVQIGVPVITGFPDYHEYLSAEKAKPSSKQLKENGRTIYYDHFNSIGVFNPDGSIGDVYHKSQLVPFGERVPYIDAAPFLAELLSWDVGISTWGVGGGPHAIDLPLGGRTVRFAGMVCFESVYPNMVRVFVDDGAEFLTIVTNDGWYLGTPGPLQHERFAMLRAIETRRGIARAANTGISCTIWPDGRIINETAEGERRVLRGSIPLNDAKTLYVQFGDWLPLGALLGAIGLLVFTLIRREDEMPDRDPPTSRS